MSEMVPNDWAQRKSARLDQLRSTIQQMGLEAGIDFAREMEEEAHQIGLAAGRAESADEMKELREILKDARETNYEHEVARLVHDIKALQKRIDDAPHGKFAFASLHTVECDCGLCEWSALVPLTPTETTP